jgi:CRP-like cAMP-binding protein
MIGVSRETVTRLMGEFRNKGLIRLQGSNLFVIDKAALEGVVNL